MELKTKDQYSYFIYPYMVDKKKYNRYILKLLKNKKCKVKLFERERDSEVYTYFNPTIRRVVFPSLEYNKLQLKKFKEYDEIMKAKILSQGMCTMFEYDLGNDVQGKAGMEDGIFFKIEKIEILCFDSGICFILIKTKIENSDSFSDVLDFNYKFRDINSKLNKENADEDIKIQTDSLDDIKMLSDIIDEITEDSEDVQAIDVDTNRFLTYSYTCLEQECWNSNKSFDDIKNEFYKFSNILPSAYSSTLEANTLVTASKWQYTKIGITQTGTALLNSGVETDNFTMIPYMYENQLIYTYIIALYQRLRLKQLIKEFKESDNIIEISKDLLEFTKSLWIKEITHNELGSELYRKWREVLGLSYLYKDLKNIYEIKYRQVNIEKTNGMSRILIFALCGTITINVINYLMIISFK